MANFNLITSLLLVALLGTTTGFPQLTKTSPSSPPISAAAKALLKATTSDSSPKPKQPLPRLVIKLFHPAPSTKQVAALKHMPTDTKQQAEEQQHSLSMTKQQAEEVDQAEEEDDPYDYTGEFENTRERTYNDAYGYYEL